MQFLILGLLLDGPHSLYDVHKRFTGGISLFYAASFGSIQRALKQLEEHGRVTVEKAADSRRRKRLYSSTVQGREAWHQWMLSPIIGSDVDQMMLSKIFLLGHLPPSERSECIALIRMRVGEEANALGELADRLDDEAVPIELREIYRYQRATLNHGIGRSSLTLEWLDELEMNS